MLTLANVLAHGFVKIHSKSCFGTLISHVSTTVGFVRTVCAGGRKCEHRKVESHLELLHANAPTRQREKAPALRRAVV